MFGLNILYKHPGQCGNKSLIFTGKYLTVFAEEPLLSKRSELAKTKDWLFIDQPLQIKR